MAGFPFSQRGSAFYSQSISWQTALNEVSSVQGNLLRLLQVHLKF